MVGGLILSPFVGLHGVVLIVGSMLDGSPALSNGVR